jgi:hypothetical protein
MYTISIDAMMLFRNPFRASSGDKLRAGLSPYISRPGGWEREDTVQVEKLTALEAYLAGTLYLPPGYGLEYGAEVEVLLLRRDNGSVVAGYSARGTTPDAFALKMLEQYRDGLNTTIPPTQSSMR